MRVYLIGFMGSGKSTIGKKLASTLDYNFIDLDHYIEEQENSSIQDVFQLKGEGYFRKIESKALLQVSKMEKIVISLGGGTPCFEDNATVIYATGISVYLELSAAGLFSRLVKNRGDRPLLMTLNDNELKNYIEKTLEERNEYYQQANLVVSALSFSSKKYGELAKELKSYSK